MQRNSSSPSTPESRRLAYCYVGLAGMFVLAALSQAKLQLVERNGTLELGRKTNRFTQERKEPAIRGAILARNGKALALEDDSVMLELDLNRVPHNDGFFMDLSAASGIPAGEFDGLIAAGEKQKAWKHPITTAQAEEIRKVKTFWRADGVSIVRSGRREYPMEDEASGIVGLVLDGKALTGVEVGLDKELSGVDGDRIGLVDKSGFFLPLRSGAGNKPRVDGQSVTLTIDSNLQAAAAEAVKGAVVRNHAENGVGVVLDPQTGEIYAMANYPSFRPYNPDGSDGDLSANSGYNPAYMSALEPGSTFKILTLAKALDAGKVTMQDHIYCSSEMLVDGVDKWKVHCDDHKPHYDVTPELAIAKSCNVAAAGWALKVGRTDFLAYINSLGLLKKSDLGLPQEARGHYNTKEWAQRLQLANMGFGQAIITTPVALASAFSMIANDGVRVPPSLIKQIGSKPMPIPAGERIIRSDTAEKVRHCMEAVIEGDSGTGKTLRIPGYRLAGKTGTAQKIGKTKGGFVASFVGFVPSQKPRAVILVMINNPHTPQYHGAVVAGPAFVDIAKSVIREFNIPATEPILEKPTMKR